MTPTVQIHGKPRKIGELFFRSPDFYATLVDGDDDFVIVRDEHGDEGEDLILFEWRGHEMESRSEENECRPLRRGRWVLAAADYDASMGITR